MEPVLRMSPRSMALVPLASADRAVLQAVSPGIRRDTGMYEGWSVPIDYDPPLAKLIGYGENREQVIARLGCALNEYFVGGIKTNISLFRRILRNPDFRAANLDTGFLDRMLKQQDVRNELETDPQAAHVAAIAAGMFAALAPAANGTSASTPDNGSRKVSTWRKIGRDEALR